MLIENISDDKMRENAEATKMWLQNMSDEELEEFAIWLVENGHGFYSQEERASAPLSPPLMHTENPHGEKLFAENFLIFEKDIRP